MSKKFLTKLLDSSYRNRTITSISEDKLNAYKIPQYARYTVDKCIISRNDDWKDDKDRQYGFQPLEVLAYIRTDGELIPKLFEFNTVNHFLKLNDGDTAVEVVKAILVNWVKTDKNIRDFNIDDIDKGLKQLEERYIEEQKQAEAEAEKQRKELEEQAKAEAEAVVDKYVTPEKVNEIAKRIIEKKKMETQQEVQ